MKHWINALIVDDDPDYVQILAADAAAIEINLMHCSYWNEAKERISQNPRDYEVIVLDGKGQLSADSKREDMAHSKQAQIDIAEMRGQGIPIPFVVLTGYVESEIIAHNVSVFRKGTQEKQLFAKIKELAAENPAFRMRSIYPDIVPLLQEDRMGKTAEAHFLELFSQMEPTNFSGPDPRNPIRKLVEAFCIQAAKIGIIDGRLAPLSGKVNLTSCGIFIQGHEVWYPNKEKPTHRLQTKQGIFDEALTSSFQYILRNTQAGSHFKEGDPCSPHLAKALFHALAVLLSWLQKFATDHPDDTENRKSIQVERTS